MNCTLFWKQDSVFFRVAGKVYRHYFVTGMLEKNIQHVGGSHFQCPGIFTGVAAEELLLLGFPVHHQLYLVFGVKEQGKDGGRAGLYMEQLLHGLGGGKTQAGGADLMGKILSEEWLVAGHSEKVEVCFLAIAEYEVLADIRTQRITDGNAILHSVCMFVLDPLEGDREFLKSSKYGSLSLTKTLSGNVLIDR